MAQVIVEFYGVPRHRAGRPQLLVAARTVGDALTAVSVAVPGLADLLANGRLAPHYLLSINGDRFTLDLSEELDDGVTLLLFSADAGG